LYKWLEHFFDTSDRKMFIGDKYGEQWGQKIGPCSSSYFFVICFISNVTVDEEDKAEALDLQVLYSH
jgi:hypothetical protein